MDQRKYEFNWGVIGGNLETARPSLGPTTRVEVYRLFQFTLRDVLEQNFGHEKADELFRQAGVLSGKAFFENFCKNCTDLTDLVKSIQENFKKLGIGIFRIEEVNEDASTFTMTVDEDLDCSGLPDTSDEICVYDEGFIQGILESFTGKKFSVREVDCWCAGARTCRFGATLKD